MDDPWTLSALVAEVERRIAALPAPRNGQVRAIPDERTIRYYGTIGLLDRPSAMRGRTALYGRKHVAQIIAIKRLQSMGRSLAEIQGVWPTLDDHTLARMSGVELPAPSKPAVRAAFWKREAQPSPAHREPPHGDATPDRAAAPHGDAPADRAAAPHGDAPANRAAVPHGDAPENRGAAARGAAAAMRGGAVRSASPVELRVELAPGAALVLSVDEGAAIALTPADVRALRAAAAPLLAELASRRLASHPGGEEP